MADLGAQIQALDTLRNRRTITETEHALLRKRLIETWALRDRPSAGGEAASRSTLGGGRLWVIGQWEGGHYGPEIHMDGSYFVFAQEQKRITWYMRRRTAVREGGIRNWSGRVQASGVVRTITD